MLNHWYVKLPVAAENAAVPGLPLNLYVLFGCKVITPVVVFNAISVKKLDSVAVNITSVPAAIVDCAEFLYPL